MKKQVFVLYPTVDNKYFTLEELKENLKDKQTNKDGNWLFFMLVTKRHNTLTYKQLRKKGYEVLL
jgi:molecular chaperone HtpG